MSKDWRTIKYYVNHLACSVPCVISNTYDLQHHRSVTCKYRPLLYTHSPPGDHRETPKGDRDEVLTVDVVVVSEEEQVTGALIDEYLCRVVNPLLYSVTSTMSYM